MRWLIIFLFCVVISATAQAASIEARLISASNEGEKTDEQLAKLEPKLKKIFGYLHYHQLGLQTAPIQQDTQTRLDLGEGIVVLVTPRTEEKKRRLMDFEMYSGRAAIIKSVIRVGHGELLVRGPEVGGSVLLLSLTVVE